ILAAVNAEWQKGPFTARALYARFNVDSDTAKTLKRDLQQGYYVEAGYRFLPDVGGFVRYNVYDDIRRAAVGSDDFEVKQTDVGVNYWLNPNVVFKADYQLQSGADDDDGFNLGVGYQF
ncbi:MAG: porin, partial [Nevskiales bacterium]